MERLVVGEWCFLRKPMWITVHGTMKHLPRASEGFIAAILVEENLVHVRFVFSDGKRHKLACRPEWVEAGDTSLLITMQRMSDASFYNVGMMVSDLKWPDRSMPAYSRFVRNMLQLCGGNQGTSFYPGINFFNAKDSFLRLYQRKPEFLDRKVGLVLCGAPHPWDRWNWNLDDFHTQLCRSLLAQWPRCKVIVWMRYPEGRNIERVMARVRRVRVYHGDTFKLHYRPLNMRECGPEPTYVVAPFGWSAVVIAPYGSRPTEGIVDVPAEVLRTMLAGQCALELGSFTCEGAQACMEHVRQQRHLYGIK